MIQADLLAPSQKRYHIQEQIGSGGMGIVYRAHDRLTETPVALKSVLVAADAMQFSGADQTDDVLIALVREFQILAGLRHPNIISVLDFSVDQQQRPFYTMALLDQPCTIIEAARENPRPIDLLSQLLEALVYLHRHGIIHRDLKPSNVLVAHDQVYVLDFGLAWRDIARTAQAGTAGYIAPETLRTGQVSFASDLYAVGVIAYEMMTGLLPFHPNDVLSIMDEPPDLSPIQDAQIAEVIGRLLAKHPEQRYPNARAAQQALSPLKSDPLLHESYLQAAPFVGREAELHRLLEALKTAQGGKSQLLLVGGENGVGKSRLLNEFRSYALVAKMLVLRGQAVPENARPFEMWRELLRHLLLIVTIDDSEAAILKDIVPDIERLLKRSIPSVPALNGKEHEKRLADTLIKIIIRYPDPLVLLLEDIHWSQDDLRLAARLHRVAAANPLLILATYRSDEQPNLPELAPSAAVIHLPRLSQHNIQELIVAILGSVPKRLDLLPLITQETEGNTFFIVETLRVLMEKVGNLNLLDAAELPRHVLTGDMKKLLERRVNQVTGADYELLKIAALIGRRIDLKLLAQIAPEMDLSVWLYRCKEAVVLEPEDMIWRFAHDKLRDVLVENVSAGEKKVIYQHIAAAMEAIYPASEEFSEPLAHHWHSAGNDIKTTDYAITAGNFLDQRGYYARAKTTLNLGLDAAKAAGLLRQEAELLARLGRIHYRISEHDQAYILAQQAFVLAQELEDLSLQGLGLRVMSDARERQGDIQEAEALMKQSLAVYRAADDHRGIAYALYGIGYYARFNGNVTEALAYFAEILPIAEALGDELLFTNTLMRMSAFHRSQGSFEQSEKLNLRALTMAQKIQYRLGEGVSNIMLGVLYHEMADIARAELHYSQALPIFQELDDPYGVAECTRMIAMFAMLSKNFERALHYGQAALESAHQISSLEAELLALLVLGRNAVYSGRYVDASAYFTQMATLNEQNQDPAIHAKVYSNFYLLALAQRDYETAYTTSKQAVELARPLNQPITIATHLVQFALSCMQSNRLTEGRIALLEVYDLIKNIPQISIHLDVIECAAHLFSQNHPLEAAKWWTFVLNHPLTYPAQRDLIARLGSTLEDILGEDAFYDIVEAETDHDVSEILQEVMALLI